MAPAPWRWPDLRVLTEELVSAAEAPSVSGRVLSDEDHDSITWRSSGAMVLFDHSIVTPLLRAALVDALATPAFAGFAGRLTLRESNPRMYDVSCNNAGVRFVAASTTATLEQFKGALYAQPYSSAGVANPWAGGPFWLPQDPAQIVKEQHPLTTLSVIHLSGGGGLVGFVSYHGLVDFEAIQTFVSHLSAAYNARLAAKGLPAGPTAPPADRRDPVLDPAAVEALADPAPLPPGVPHRRLDEWVPRGPLALLRVIGKALWHVLRGGGMEARHVRVSAERLAAIKQRAAAELAEERKASAAAAAGGGGGGDAVAEVEWVSSADALSARLIQVIHSAPSRRPHPMSAFLAVNMRPRVDPPLPPASLGNALGWVVLERVRPAAVSLGRLAAAVRHGLNNHVVPQYKSLWSQRCALMARHGHGGVIPCIVLHDAPYDNIFGVEGPLLMTFWAVKHELWQFGPAPPSAVLPYSNPAFNVVRMHAEREGGGVAVALWLHKAMWKQLDAVTGGDLAGAL